MTLDPLLLSRLQFAWVIAWHILLPAFTVGLASYIAMLETLHVATGRGVFLRLSNFWTRIFAISFGMGVVTGITMPFQLGTNWSRYADATANVTGPLFAYEGLTAFFLEAAFLGVLLFGRKLVPPWMHLISALLVAAGTLFSSFWILSANSWMQTPAGYTLRDGRFFPESWMAIIFNPSFPYRLAHTVSGFYVTTALVVLGVGAYALRRTKAVEEGRVMITMALWFLLLFVPVQMVLGDLHGLNTGEHQPAKLAAIEGLWESGRGVPASIVALPDMSGERNDYELSIPKLGSLYLTHSLNGEVKGLKDFPPDQRPPVAIVYFAFRLMVGCGLVMLAMVATGMVLWFRDRVFETEWYLRLCQMTAPLGFVAVIAGWTTTEVGRQPWTVYGLLRTADSVSPNLTGEAVLVSLLAYVSVYLFVYPTGLVLMGRIVRKGPETAFSPGSDAEGPPVESGRPEQPYRAAVAGAAGGIPANAVPGGGRGP